jgi:hypothetical protein
MGISQTPQALVPAEFTSGGMTLLASGSIAASATGVDISSIPTTYNEIWLYLYGVSVSTAASPFIRFNGNSTGSNYSWNVVRSGTNTLVSTNGTSEIIMANAFSSAATTGNAFLIRLPNYKSTTSWKMCQTLGLPADNDFTHGAGMWRITDAITQIQFFVNTGAFDAGTYQLFGVK